MKRKGRTPRPRSRPAKPDEAAAARRALEGARAAQRTERYVLRLYVSGTSRTSAIAIERVRRLCDEHLRGRYELDVIDIYQQPLLAIRHQIVATPTLVRERPLPTRRFIGDMSTIDVALFRVRPSVERD